MNADGSGGTALICYDGSESAGAAIAAAVPLVARFDCVVVCFWQPFADVARRFARSLLEIVQDADTVNEKERLLAEQTAAEGAELAVRLGLRVQSRAVQVDEPIDDAILNYADELEAVVIVLGARGGSGIRSLLLGDVANDVLQRATRPVLVVPSAGLAARRGEERATTEPADVELTEP
ncbi:MAG TPA: universal stress protein [Gaiellaceae bacterium]|jgi:nucleotide-binding universal stress UspA family protein